MRILKVVLELVMFDLCKADVQDKESLSIFRNKILDLQKIFIYGNDDIHSISNQYQEMIWNDTVYRTFNEARRISEITNSPNTGLPGTLIEMIDRNFFDTQAMAIRRLTDPHEFRPNRTVNSIPSIIEEIKSISGIFTRENYICYNGTPYDNSTLPEWPDQAKHEERNKQFDRIAVKFTTRSRDDLLDIEILKKLEKELQDFDLIRAYTNKYVAHAAASGNRYKLIPELKKLTLQALEDSYRKIVAICKVLGDVLDVYFLAEIATPQFDQLENWNMPFVTKEDHLELYKYWESRREMFERWDRNSVDGGN